MPRTASYVTALRDPQLHAFTRQVAEALTLSAAKAAAHLADPARYPLSGDENSIERLLHGIFIGSDERSRARLVAHALSAGEMGIQPIRRTPAIASVDLLSATPVWDQLAPAWPINEVQEALRTATVETLAAPSRPPSMSEPVVGNSATSTGDDLALYVFLRFLLCADETGGGAGEWGEDEIRLAGVSVTADGRATPLETLRIKDDHGNDFEDGSHRGFDPAKGFARIGLRDGIQPPKSVSVIFTLVEEDNGGFADVLAAIYDQVREALIAYLAAQGIAAGSALGIPGAVIGAFTTAAVAIVLDELADWLIGAWNDEIFAPVCASWTIDGFLPEDEYPWGWDDPVPVEFHGHGGHYRLWVSNRLVSEPVG